MFKWRRPSSEPSDSSERLLSVVREHLEGVDEDSVRIVAAIAGLLAAVAYADQDFSSAEEAQLRTELGRVHAMTPAKVGIIVDVLREHILDFATAHVPRFTRTLRELADRELKLEVLEVLVDLAVADGTLDQQEVSRLRTIAQSMGLSQDDYNQLQARHRDKLSFLR